MNRGIIYIGISLLLIHWIPLAWAQTSLQNLDVEYDKAYQIEASYSIIYDNPTAGAKLNEFKIEFFAADNTQVGETDIESYPVDGSTVVYALDERIEGFNKAKLTVISLHSGDIIDFPNSAASVLALNQLSEFTPPPSTNQAPNVRNARFDLEAGVTQTFRLREYYSDPDDDDVALTAKSGQVEGLQFDLLATGALEIAAHNTLGEYELTYQAIDNDGASASGQITINVVVPDDLNQVVESKKSSLEILKDQALKIETDLANLPPTDPALNDTLTQLADEIDTSIQLAETNVPVKSGLTTLRQDLDAAVVGANQQNLRAQLEALQAQLTTLDQELSAMESGSQSAGTDITELTTSLGAFGAQINTIEAKIDGLKLPIPVTADQIALWQAQHKSLKSQISTGLDWRWPLGALLALIGITGVSLGRRKKHKPLAHSQLKERADMPKINKGDLSNLSKKIPTTPLVVKPSIGIDPRKPRVLPKTPVLPKNRVLPVNIVKPGTKGNVRIPPSFSSLALNAPGLGGPRPKMEHGKVFAASSSSQITLNSLVPQRQLRQMPGSESSAQAYMDPEIQAVYRAVGRVGGSSIDGDKDHQKSFGTACLITPNHVMTNRHVSDQELYFGDGYDDMWTMKELLMYGGGWGIEFMALEDSDESIFVECDYSEPIILDGLDIAIFRLKEEVSNFAPIQLSPIDDEEFSETESVIVIGYPDHWYRSEFDNTFNAFEDDPLLAVKRSSHGPLIHDEDLPEVYTHDVSGTLPVIYHRATTLGGNSGSPVLDAVSNQVIGIHFQAIDADVVGITDDDNPGYNLAMPINEIINKLPSEITDLIEMT